MLVLPLNEKQLEQLPKDGKGCAGRIMCRGLSVNICTGYLVGGDIDDQMVYEGYPQAYLETAKRMLEKNNPKEKFQIIYSEEKQMKDLKTIDLTPTWAALIPAFIGVLQNKDASPESHQNIEKELMRLARFADAKNAEGKKNNA